MLANNSIMEGVFSGTDKDPKTIRIGMYNLHVCGFGLIRYVSYIKKEKYNKKIVKWTLVKSIFAKEVKLKSCKVFERFKMVNVRRQLEESTFQYQIICPNCWMNEFDFTKYILNGIDAGFLML